MSLAKTWFMLAITALYLLFELAFNARLLDVVGGTATLDQIHAIEVYGRTLSGIAVALVLLQIGLHRQWNAMRIIFSCAVTIGVTYAGLQAVTDKFVEWCGPEFRRNAMNTLLVRDALLSGKASFDAFDDNPDLFNTPQGKAFISLFPALLSQVDDIDSKLADEKNELVSRAVDKKSGGAASYYAGYQKAMTQLQRKWSQYANIRMPDVQQETSRQQAQRWQEYLTDLGKKGWTPSSVPAYARNTVVKRVRVKLPALPRDWHPADEAAFKEAVAQTVRRKVKAAGDGSVTVGGKRVPPGLGFKAFVAHSGVQFELAQSLETPRGVLVRASYDTAEQFRKEMYEPWRLGKVKQAIDDYNSPLETFYPGAKNHRKGEDAVRAVVVPPLALFFSLTGAIGHFGKLLFILSGLPARRLLQPTDNPDRAKTRKKVRNARIALLGTVIFGSMAALAMSDNDITKSSVYTFIRNSAEKSVGDVPLAEKTKTLSMINAMHIVAVGQGVAYPMTETIRTKILNGITYGYDGPAK